MTAKSLILGAVLWVAAAGTALAEPGDSYGVATAATAPVADAYVAAYTSLNWDKIDGLLDDKVNFRDRTAELVFGAVGADDKAALMKLFRDGYSVITKMRFIPVRTIHSGHYGIYEGDLNWTVKMPDGRLVETTAPFVLTVRVEGGKVVEHRDFVDYAPFIAAMRRSEKAG